MFKINKMNNKYIYIIVAVLFLIAGYTAGKYNNSPRYTFHNERLIILDTYTGSMYINGKEKKLIRSTEKDQ